GRPARLAERRDVRVLADGECAGADGLSAPARLAAARHLGQAGDRARVRHRRLDLRLRLVVDAVRLGRLRAAVVPARGPAAGVDGAGRLRGAVRPARPARPDAALGSRARFRGWLRLHVAARRAYVAAARHRPLLRPAEAALRRSLAWRRSQVERVPARADVARPAAAALRAPPTSAARGERAPAVAHGGG